MQALDESRIEGLKDVWEGYIGLETKLVADAQVHLDSMLHSVRAIDASIDSAVFVRTHKTPWTAPGDQPFESSPTFNDTVSFCFFQRVHHAYCFYKVPVFLTKCIMDNL